MMKRIALAAVAASLFAACGGGNGNEDEDCTIDTNLVCADKECGTVQAKDSCGATQTVTCGNGCNEAAGEVCQANKCISNTVPTCTVSEADKAQACVNRCGTIKVLDSCNEMQDVACGDQCGGGTVCNPNLSSCVDPATCTVDLEAACETNDGSLCGPQYRVLDSCGRPQNIDCGCDASGFVDNQGIPIPAENMICLWGTWYPKQTIVDYFTGRYCAAGAAGSSLNFCGNLDLGAVGCGGNLEIECPASNCVEDEDTVCSQNLCVNTSVCSGSRDVVSAWIGGSTDPDEPDASIDPEPEDASVEPEDASVEPGDASVDPEDAGVDPPPMPMPPEAASEGLTKLTATPKTGYAYISDEKVFGTYRDTKTNTQTRYTATEVLVGANGISEPTLLGAAIDLSGSNIGQDNHYDWTCDAADGKACFGVWYVDATTSGANRIFYEAKSGTMTLTAASLTAGFAGEVNNAEMYTWMLAGDKDICTVPNLSFSFEFPASNSEATNTLFDAECTSDLADLLSIDGSSIEADAQDIVVSKNKELLMTTDLGDAIFVFGINAAKKLSTIQESLALDSYVGLDDDGYLYCDAEPDEEYGDPGICAAFWYYTEDAQGIMLNTLYDMVEGTVFVDSVTDTLEGSIYDAIFQIPEVDGVCDATSTPISFSFSGKIGKAR